MLGDKIGTETGQLTGQRVLATDGPPKVETSFRATGTLLGVKHMTMGTYASVMRPDGTVYGSGQGVVMGEQNHMATWNGGGVGTPKADGSINYRGAIYYHSASPKWSQLNGMAAVYEYDVDAKGNTHAQLWEWK